MFDKMVYLRDHADHLRLRMLREPRGYPAANCNLVLPSNHPDADAGFVIMEQVEYPPMSGTNTICVVTVLIETGMVPAAEPVTHLKLETPAGLIAIDAEVRDGKVPQGHLPQCPRLRHPPGHPYRSPRTRHRDGRCRLWRHVLRDRRRRVARLHAWRPTKPATSCASPK